MKLFIISDIHGSYSQAKKAVEKFKELQCDKFVALGDLYYHGPRNPLPNDYQPKRVAELLNSIASNVIAIRGNCDAEVDQMISDFTILEKVEMLIDNKNYLFVHGHHEIEHYANFNAVFSGHTHIFKIEKRENTLFVNPGSITLPKAEHSSNYIVLENGIGTIKDINTDELIQTFTI